MRMFSTKVLAAVACAVTIPAILTAGSANADPLSNTPPRAYHGMGSDTTEEVMNAISEAVTVGGVKVLASWNAKGGALTTKDASCAYASNLDGSRGAGIRADGSGDGKSRLLEASTAGNPLFDCLDFARSSNSSLLAGQQHYALGVDALTYAVRRSGTASKVFTLAQLQGIYNCTAVGSFTPLVPQAGSGTRSSWLTLMGLNPANPLPSCVKDVTPDGTPIQENDGNFLTRNTDIVPYSASQWSAMSIGSIADKRATAVLGGINGITALSSNAASASTRRVYNVVPTAKISSDATLASIFVGSSSLVCTQGATAIAKSGFASLGAECGSTN